LWSKAERIFDKNPSDKHKKIGKRKRNTGKMQNGETTASHSLFQTIGKGAEDVDNIPNGDEAPQKLVEEIESMCINCEENVLTSFLPSIDVAGYNKITTDKNPILSRSYNHVILLSSLRYISYEILIELRIFQCGNTECRPNPTTWIEIHL
jgi:hypothetical protein